MSKDFDFRKSEEKWRKFWEKEKVYKFNLKSKKKIYSIDTPPPTVSGEMHIGHACSYSQQDFLVRFKRMNGFNVFYPFGTDDNGLPTERLVEKRKNVKSKEMSREAFIKLCMSFLKEELPRFIQDWKDIGISCDWDAYYSTINEHSRRISQWSFLDLYKKGRMERRDAPAMYCPECQTGIAQVEVEDKEIPSKFVDVKLKVEGKDLIISTTRPELFPASVAVFYHPDDERYKHLKGKTAKIPLFDIEVPILEDKRTQKDKGTGIAYCATFGDQTDMEWQKAYNLPIKEAISREGKMTSLAGKYEGMVIKDARKKIIEDLKKGEFVAGEKSIVHPVNVHERCGTEIEFVKSKQWFLRYLDLKKDMLKWGAELNWHPGFMKVRYDNWVKGLQWDWLVSNQRHFGVSFPVWYCEDCDEVIVADEKKLPVDPISDNPPVKKCPKCNSKNIIPETDVLNTWFTSSMTPQIVNELVDRSMRKKVFPMSLRPQAHDIISFWLFNTVVKSQLHFGKNPWKDVAISGFVTLKGEKMSKSKGNVVRPQEVMEKYGADAIRYWAASSKLGEDFDYQEKDVITGKRFVIKLLNSSKFVFMNLKDWDGKKPKTLEPLDEMFLNELNRVVGTSTLMFEGYEYSRAKLDAEGFFWKHFCDNYLEIVKNRVYNGNKKEKESAFYTLYHSLLALLKLFAPITPFITEEIYQEYYRKNEKDKSIHISSWPEQFKMKTGKGDEKVFDLMLDVISRVRQAKSNAKKSVKAEIILTLDGGDKKILEKVLQDLMSVTNSKEIREGKFNVEFV
ncbi:valine--tRNA ligase [Candidatus Pacearchaeota archaeon CG10_big_fil_rev_8_21_14_0_10_34_12]|nr:MAG: valine--tRNA ligase [Candidatus Pacearchaeota archaeon CG10_big_fil_rev_8_21_14_0_10_34_12]